MFISFSLNANNSLNLDERLVIPKGAKMPTALHFGHAGRDAMSREAADVWWPKIHQEIIEKATNRPERIRAGNILKCHKSEKLFGTLPKADKPNEEISFDFAMLVSQDINSGWPECSFRKIRLPKKFWNFWRNV